MDTTKENIQSFNFKEKEKTKKAYMKTESHERQKAQSSNCGSIFKFGNQNVICQHISGS